MSIVDLNVKKRDGGEFSDDEIAVFVDGYTRGEIPDYQAAAWCMATFLNGMSPEETGRLIETTRARLGNRPFGAGVVAFAAPKEAKRQLAAIRKARPDYIVLAGGDPATARRFEDAGIATRRDGVIVDKRMRTSAKDVFACGDCTSFRSFITGKPIPGKLATNGIFQGKTAALNAVGEDRVFDGFLNACATDVFGLRMGSVGIREEDAAEADMEVMTGTGVSRNSYPMFTDSREVRVKLVFRADDGHWQVDERLHVEVVDKSGFFVLYGSETEPEFARGDVNADGEIDISDAIYTLGYLFAGAREPDCLKAADSNDDGGVDLADAITILQYLFAGGAVFPPPFPLCGTDPTEDPLECLDFPPCR